MGAPDHWHICQTDYKFGGSNNPRLRFDKSTEQLRTQANTLLTVYCKGCK